MATSGRNPDTGTRTPFSEQLVSQRSAILAASSTDELNILRDAVALVNNGAVTSTDSEFLVNAPAASDSALLKTALRGRYTPGFAAEVGVGIRLNARATGGTVEWGAFDDDDGLSFFLDDDGLAARITRNGSVTLDVDSTNWNIDPLDGTGPSRIDVADSGGLEAFLQEGHIWQIRFTWYGYGMIEWAIIDQTGPTAEQKVWPLHRAKVSGSTSIEDPSLPVGIRCTDNASTYVGGRQYTVLGPVSVNERNVGDFRIGQSVPRADTTTWIPLIGIKRRSDVEWANAIRIVTDDFEIVTDEKFVVQLFIGPTLDDGTYEEVQNSDGSSAVLVNNDCTSMTFPGGTFPNQTIGLDPVIVLPSSTASKDAVTQTATKRTPLPNSQELVLAVLPTATGTAATVDTVFDWLEIR